MTTTQALNYFFAYDLSSASGEMRWGLVPADLWRKLLCKMGDIFGIDAVGFQNVQSIDALKSYPAFSELPFGEFVSMTYSPYHQVSTDSIAAFRIDSALLAVLKGEDFDQWNAANESLPFDELVFFQGNRVRIIAVPYENTILFQNVGIDELHMLAETDERFAKHVHKQHERKIM